MDKGFSYTREVREALSSGKPVVALESTIVAHGMPYPENVATAMEVENIVRSGGAVPATIAIVKGVVKIGLTGEELNLLGSSKSFIKASTRDIPYAISMGLDAATTVASTMRLASLAGIRVFVTGGIGGVHRGAAATMDISADLAEMAITDVAIVSAGIKSILDIGLTLEYLETAGIPVITYGSDEFPSFYSRKSGFKTPVRMDEATTIGKLMYSKWKLGLKGSVLIANPVPEENEIKMEEMEKHISKALAEAHVANIHGKDVTPFLLGRIGAITGGKSLQANIALVKNNALLGTAIAVALSRVESSN